MIYVQFIHDAKDLEVPQIKVDPHLWEAESHLQPFLSAVLQILGTLIDAERQQSPGAKTLHVAQKKLILPGEDQ